MAFPFSPSAPSHSISLPLSSRFNFWDSIFYIFGIEKGVIILHEMRSLTSKKWKRWFSRTALQKIAVNNNRVEKWAFDWYTASYGVITDHYNCSNIMFLTIGLTKVWNKVLPNHVFSDIDIRRHFFSFYFFFFLILASAYMEEHTVFVSLCLACLTQYGIPQMKPFYYKW